MIRTYETRRAATLAAIPLVAALVVMATSCHSDAVGPPLPEVTAVRVSGLPSDGVLLVGDTLRLSASTTDVTGQTRLDGPVAWNTSNPAVATVSTRGTVSGVTAGTAIIKATSGSASATAVVTVHATIIPPPAGASAPVVQSILGGKLVLSIPPGAVPSGIARLSVGPASAPPASAELLPGTAFEFGPSGTRFNSPLQLTLTFDPASFPAVARAGLAIYHVVGDDYEEVLNSVVDNTTNAVSAPIFGFSSYAILRRAAPASVVASDGGGDGQGGTAGAPVRVRPAVRVLDARGRPVAFVDVTFAVTAGGGSIAGATQVTDRNGIATVGSWTLGPNKGANSLTATVAGLPSVSFTASAVVQVPAWLVITGQPSSSPAGTLPAVFVSVRDGNNAVTPLFTGPVTIALGANPTNASLGGTRTVNAVAGVATFADLTLNQPGKYTLVVSSPSLVGATSNAFDIVAGLPSSLKFDAYPLTGAVTGSELPPVTVVARDALGNVATGFVGPVSLGLASAPPGGTLQGVTTVNSVAGVAQFSHTRLNVTGSYRLQAQSSGLPTVIGQDFVVRTPSTGPALTVVGGNGQSAHIGATLPSPIVVQLSANGQPVAGQTVSFAVATGGGQVSPTSAVTNSLGQASTSWTLGGASGVQTMTAATGSLPPVTIFAAAGTGLHLGVRQQPAATQVIGSTVIPAFIVEMRDDNDAVVTSFSGTVSLSIGANPGATTLIGTTVVAAVGGVATFDAFRIDRPGNGYTVVASTGPYSATSSTFNVLATGAAAAIVTISTTGTDLPSTLTFVVDDCPTSSLDDCSEDVARQVGPNTSFIINLPPGRHLFYVVNVPLNCSAPSPQLVNLPTGQTVSISIGVTCSKPGTIRVTAPTSGTDPAASYSVLIDGRWGGDVIVGSSLSIQTGEGAHTVELTGVPANCTVNSSNPTTATVIGGSVTDVSFSVSCVPNPTLSVTVTTTGTHIPAEFTVGVDYYYYYYYYQYTFTVPSNGSASLRIPPGAHTVYLDTYTGNCTVTSANAVPVTLVLGSSRSISYTVVCR